MANPILTKATNPQSPFTFDKSRFLPLNEPRNPNIITGRAGGGQVKIASLGDTERFWTLVINRVSQANRNNLLTFLEDSTVEWSVNTVTFTDEDSNTFTVRIWNVQGIDFPKVKGGLYNIKLLLREEIV